MQHSRVTSKEQTTIPGKNSQGNPCSFRSKTIRLQLQSQIETHNLKVFVRAPTSGYPYCQT